MTVLNTSVLARAGGKNAPLRKALDQWLQTTEAATWGSLQDVRATFATADGVVMKTAGGVDVAATIFNVKGNQYRLITIISYAAATVLVGELLTPPEYSSDRWKDRL